MEPAAGAVASAPPAGGDGQVEEPVPVTVLAGFLGAGKTTLLNRILAGGHGLRIAVIVNDFGAVNIDSRLVVDRDATMVTLDNGCICCSMAGDLVTQLTSLLERAGAPEHVVVETSGVSDPSRILVGLRDRHLRTLARVDGVVTLVDSGGALEIPPKHVELARRQLAAADVIVFNKTDLVSAGQLAELHERLTYPSARVIDTVGADVPLDVLLGVRRASRPSTCVLASARHDTQDFATWSWSSSRPLAYRTIRDVLMTLPGPVYRAKGFLYVAETPESRVVAHVVGRRVDLRPAGAWGDGVPMTELVFISLDGAIDAVALRKRLAGAAADRPGPAIRPDDEN